MSPGRPNAHPGRTPSPTPHPFVPPHPEKTVTLLPHPFPGLPHPTPTHDLPRPHACAISSHQSALIPQFRHSLWKYTYKRAILAYARNRPRGPGSLPPNGVRPQASVGASNTSHRPLTTDAPPVLLCHMAPPLCPNNPRQHYRFARDRRHPQLGGAQNVAESNRFRLPAKPVPVKTGSGNNGVRGSQAI